VARRHDALVALERRLRAVPFVLDLPSRPEAVRTRDQVVQQVTDYLLPRLARLDAPLLAVLGGSTGSGKSTLVNSLVGANLSQPGVLRPTTRAPVLVCHPDDRDAFAASRDGEPGVLPDLPRVHGPGQAAGLHLQTSTTLRRGLALLDSPDIDSVEVAHHDLAAQLLGAADLWLFVTTAARYADAVPWGFLAAARERSVALAVVVNRVPVDAIDPVRGHLVSMLADHGLGGTPVFAVPEEPLDDHRIGASLDELRGWLDQLAADADARRAVVLQSLEGALQSLPARVDRVVAGVDAQLGAAAGLRDAAGKAFGDAADRIADELGSGVLLRSQVLERFRDHVGTADWMDRLQRGIGRLRDRVTAAVTRTPPPVEQAREAIEDTLADLIRHEADEAALATVEAWRALPGGPSALALLPDGADRASEGLPAAATREVARWQDHVIQLVRDRAGSRMALARGLSLGVNGAGVALMVAVFAQTGGLTGGEAAVAGGTAAVSQALLTAVFGEQAVRDLTRAAHDDLFARVRGLLADEKDRLVGVLHRVADSDDAAGLRDAVDDVARADA
jgi:energy-coupling factor transporter ATP-binding protein EcfA2